MPREQAIICSVEYSSGYTCNILQVWEQCQHQRLWQESLYSQQQRETQGQVWRPGLSRHLSSWRGQCGCGHKKKEREEVKRKRRARGTYIYVCVINHVNYYFIISSLCMYLFRLCPGCPVDHVFIVYAHAWPKRTYKSLATHAHHQFSSTELKL